MITDQLEDLQPVLPHRNGNGAWHWADPEPIDLAPVADVIGKMTAELVAKAVGEPAKRRKAEKMAKRARKAAQRVREIDERLSRVRVMKPKADPAPTDEVGTPTFPGFA